MLHCISSVGQHDISGTPNSLEFWSRNRHVFQKFRTRTKE